MPLSSFHFEYLLEAVCLPKPSENVHRVSESCAEQLLLHDRKMQPSALLTYARRKASCFQENLLPIPVVGEVLVISSRCYVYQQQERRSCAFLGYSNNRNGVPMRSPSKAPLVVCLLECKAAILLCSQADKADDRCC